MAKFINNDNMQLTINSDIDTILYNKQIILEKWTQLNDEINNIKENRININNSELNKQFQLKNDMLENIGNKISEMSECIKIGGDNEMSIKNKLNDDIINYKNIINEIKNQNNELNINVKDNDNYVKNILINLHNKINNEYYNIGERDRENKQLKMNDLVDKLNDIYENENTMKLAIINKQNNENHNEKLTNKTKKLQEIEKQNKILNEIINEKYDDVIKTYIEISKKNELNTKKHNNKEIKNTTINKINEKNINEMINNDNEIYFDIYSNEVNDELHNDIHDINNTKYNNTIYENNINENKQHIKINDKKYFNMLGQIKKYNDNKFYIISPKKFNNKIKLLYEKTPLCDDIMLDMSNKIEIENMNYVLDKIQNIDNIKSNVNNKINNTDVYKLIIKLDEIPENKLNEIIEHYNNIMLKTAFNKKIIKEKHKRTRSRSRKTQKINKIKIKK